MEVDFFVSYMKENLYHNSDATQPVQLREGNELGSPDEWDAISEYIEIWHITTYHRPLKTCKGDNSSKRNWKCFHCSFKIVLKRRRESYFVVENGLRKKKDRVVPNAPW